MAFRWRTDDGPTICDGLVVGSCVIFKGILSNIAKKPYIFVIFQGGGRPPSGSAHELSFSAMQKAKMGCELP